MGGGYRIHVFNWHDQPETIAVRLPKACRLTDYWTGADLGRQQGSYTVRDLAPHSARALLCR
jgi:hypothetical protein